MRLPWVAVVVVMVAASAAGGAVLLKDRDQSPSAAAPSPSPLPSPAPSPTPSPSPSPAPPSPSPSPTPDVAAQAARTTPPAPSPEPPTPLSLLDRLRRTLARTTSCLVVRVGTEETVSYNADLPLAPASTQKVLVAAAALDRLGPDYRFVTRVVARQGPNAADGTVDEVWLVGGGDPVLSAPEWAAFELSQPRTSGAAVTPMMSLVDGMAAAGVKAVRGAVHGDDTWHDRLRYLPSWKSIYITDGDAVPLSGLTVNGGWKSWTPEGKPAENPTLYAASELARLLGGRGIAVGGADEGAAPAGAVVLASVSSPPLSTLVASMLNSSDNLSAELITRELGKRVSGIGSTEAGTRVIAEEAAKLGLPTRGMQMIDGSGLDVNNRATCMLLQKATDLGAQTQFRSIWDGLAVAGRTGTLVHRLTATPLEGRLHAKTGSIAGVVAFVGYIDGPRPIHFAFIANGTIPSARALGDDVLLAIANDQSVAYTHEPEAPALALVPSPPWPGSAARVA